MAKFLLVSTRDDDGLYQEMLYGMEDRMHDDRGSADAAAARLNASAPGCDWGGEEPPAYAVAEISDGDAAEWPRFTTATVSLAAMKALEAATAE